MPKIVRHLIDEERLAGPVHARIVQIFFTEPQKVLGRQVREYARVAGTLEVGIASLQFEHHPGNIRQFLRTFDARMRRENLLDERRSGTRQSDDEDRVGALATHTCAAREELARTALDLQARVALDGFRPVTAFRFLERIASLIETERFRVIAAVLEGLAERKAQVIAVR